MSEETKQATAEASAPAISIPSASEPKVEAESKPVELTEGATANGEVEAMSPKEIATDAPTKETEQKIANDKQSFTEEVTLDKPATTQERMEAQDEINADEAAPAADESTNSTADTPTSGGKTKARRKSSGVPEHKGKKLNKKSSKAKMSHSDAKPGDYFYVRLKGYPLWPAIVCDESMLPQNLLKTRPVTAARPDGSYRGDYEDGGKKVNLRTFPVMYLHTNEFGFIPNFDLLDIDFDDVANIPANTRKDLAAARLLAAEKHDLDYFKEVLKHFMEAKQADLAAKEAAKVEQEEKKAKTLKAKKEKKSSKTVDAGADEDTEMPDTVADLETEDADGKSKTKKRPADETLPAGSAKKPKLKLTHSTPKATNGTATPKSTKDKSASKPAKPKSVKKDAKVRTPEIVVPKEPELTAEEKRVKKEKEILFLRHKLQKGLLTKGQDPKEEEMKQMSEYVGKLEGYSDLEVSIIRATKINKVLKAILKLSTIPKEEEYNFKTRSQTLLDKWNKILASDTTTPAAPHTNGAAGEKTEADESKDSPAEVTNGTKESSADAKVEEKAPAAEKALAVKEGPIETEGTAAVDEPMKDTPAAVESTA